MNHKEEKLFFTDKLMNIYFLKKEEEGRNQDRFFVKFFKTDRILSVSGHILASLMSISTTYCQIDWFVIVLKKNFPDTVFGTEWKKSGQEQHCFCPENWKNSRITVLKLYFLVKTRKNMDPVSSVVELEPEPDFLVGSGASEKNSGS